MRTLIRSDPAVRLIITHADRGFIEEVHFGSTPEESGRIWWDICWIWGPPEDHLQTLLRTVGVDRFLFGTGQPLRLPESSVAKLDLLDLPAEQRAVIESENARSVAPDAECSDRDADPRAEGSGPRMTTLDRSSRRRAHPRRAGALPRQRDRCRRAARLRPLDGGPAGGRRGGLGPHRPRPPPERESSVGRCWTPGARRCRIG